MWETVNLSVNLLAYPYCNIYVTLSKVEYSIACNYQDITILQVKY